jgi:hypothetical protein
MPRIPFARFAGAFPLLLAFVFVTPAFAQDGPGRISGSFSGLFGDGGLAPTVAGSAGYRFTRNLGFEIEVTALPGLDFDDDSDFSILESPDSVLTAEIGALGLVLPPPRFESTGRAITVLSNVVGEFPVGRSLRPYLVAGGGVGHVRRRFEFSAVRAIIPRLGSLDSFIYDYELSDTALALNIGGGVDIAVGKGVAVGGDLRYLRLFGEGTDYNMVRIGTRASYRF